MNVPYKFATNDALKIIDGPLSRELPIHRFDKLERTKVHLFGMGGPSGRQFAIVLGNTDAKTGHHPAQQTRILLERCDLPSLEGVQRQDRSYKGHRIAKQGDSNLAAPNQVSCLVADEASLTRLLRWYGHS
jgi:hypothetical protein